MWFLSRKFKYFIDFTPVFSIKIQIFCFCQNIILGQKFGFCPSVYFMIWNEFWDNTRICRLSHLHLAHPASLRILNSYVAPIICHFILPMRCEQYVVHRKRWKTRWVSCFHLESIMKYVMYTSCSETMQYVQLMIIIIF